MLIFLFYSNHTVTTFATYIWCEFLRKFYGLNLPQIYTNQLKVHWLAKMLNLNYSVSKYSNRSFFFAQIQFWTETQESARNSI